MNLRLYPFFMIILHNLMQIFANIMYLNDGMPNYEFTDHNEFCSWKL